MQFRQRFAKKPELNALRPQFCSDDRSRALPFCFSGQLPGLSAPRAGTSRESPSARCQQGETSEEGPNTITHRPPRTCVLHIADHLRGRAGWGCKGHRECRTGVEEGWDALPPRKIPAAGCIAEPWGQARLWGIRRHPAQRGPRPGDTHHTEP